MIDTLTLSRTRVAVGLLGTYVPQRCGIATFTKDTAEAITKHNPLNKIEVAAVDDSNNAYQYPPEVKYRILRNELQSYLDTAEHFNKSNIMLVNIQHEFGIFGGEDGEYILAFIKKLKKPFVITLHTVLEKPSSNHQKELLEEICKRSAAIIVMLPYALKILTQVYNIQVKKIYVIPHGVPESNFLDSDRIKKILNLENNIILSTFGLLSRGKGIEYAIDALPAIVKEHPSVLYLIIGATHPQILKNENEQYRQGLEEQVKKLGLEKNVRFINKFVEIDELVRYLLATDVYIVPYLSKDQISSGTLSYAIGCLNTSSNIVLAI